MITLITNLASAPLKASGVGTRGGRPLPTPSRPAGRVPSVGL
jgi:hypothetical protein